MNEKEAIKYLKKKIEDCNHIIEASSYIGNKKVYAKERTKYKEILNLIKNQQSELDKKDVTIIETKEANRQLSIELQKKDRMINEMAYYLSDFDIDEMCEKCDRCIGNGCYANDDMEFKTNCIKQYFKNKAKELLNK